MRKPARNLPTTAEARRIRREMAAFDSLPAAMRALFRETNASCQEMAALLKGGEVTEEDAIAFAVRMGVPS